MQQIPRKRKTASKRLQERIARKRLVKGKPAAAFFGSSKKDINYLFDLANAVEKRFPIGTFLQRGAMAQRQDFTFRKHEERGTGIICSEMLKMHLPPNAPPRTQAGFAEDFCEKLPSYHVNHIIGIK